MNIIEQKKKYKKVYKLRLEDLDIYYRAFNIEEILLMEKQDNIDKYKDELVAETVINKDEYRKLKNWASKELLYNNIIQVSGFKTQQELIDKKLLLKNEIKNNLYIHMIKEIIRYMPGISINKLLSFNAEQLLFYLALCEELKGEDILNSKVNNTIIPETATRKKMTIPQEDLVNMSMESSENDLKNQLQKHGIKVKEFNK